jgi:hypothetical protein
VVAQTGVFDFGAGLNYKENEMEILAAKFLHLYFWVYIGGFVVNAITLTWRQNMQYHDMWLSRPMALEEVIGLTLWIVSWAY